MDGRYTLETVTPMPALDRCAMPLTARVACVTALCGCAAHPLAGAAVLPAAAAASASGTSADWLVAPYLWAPSLQGTIGLGGATIPLNLGFRDLAGGLRAGAMGYLQRSQDSQFTYGEGLALSFAEPAFQPFFDERVRANLIFLEAGYGRHISVSAPPFLSAGIRLSPYLGVRYVRIEVDAVSVGHGIAARDRWADPVGGLLAEMPVRGGVSMIVKADVAGWGLGNDHYASGLAGLRDQVSPRWSIDVAYRVTTFHANPDNGNQLTLRLRGTGPLAGITLSL